MSPGFLTFADAVDNVNGSIKDPLTSVNRSAGWAGRGAIENSAPLAAQFSGLGFEPNGGAADAIRWTGWGSSGENWQFSFNITPEVICMDEPLAESDGLNLGATNSFADFTTAGGVSDLRRQAGPTAGLFARMFGESVFTNPIVGNDFTHAVSAARLTTQGKGVTIRIGMSCRTVGGVSEVILMTEGTIKLVTDPLSPPVAAALTAFRLGSFAQGFISDFVYAEEAAEFTTDEVILMFGTSQNRQARLTLSTPIVGNTQLDEGEAWGMLKELQTRGIYLHSSQVKVDRFPGFFMSRQKAIDVGGGSIADEIDASLALHNPTFFVVNYPSNDATQLPIGSDFQESLDYMVNAVRNFPGMKEWCGIGVRSYVGNTSIFVKVPETEARDDTVNPAYAAAAIPYIDGFDLHNGDTPPDLTTWIGDMNVTSGASGEPDDLHKAVSACILEGLTFAQTLAAIIASSPTLTTPITQGVTLSITAKVTEGVTTS